MSKHSRRKAKKRAQDNRRHSNIRRNGGTPPPSKTDHEIRRANIRIRQRDRGEIQLPEHLRGDL